MSGLRKIIISAPHSVCLKPYRDCDTRAKESAEAIARALKGRFDVSMHLSDLYRLQIDGNRRESQRTGFRNRLRADIVNSISRYGRDGVMVLDVHSCWAGSHEYTDDDGVEPVLSFISFDEKTSALCDMVKSALGKSVTCFKSGRRNDITLECKNIPVPCILIEHDEDHSRLTDEDFTRYLEVLVQYLTQYHDIAPTRPLPPRRAGPSELTIFGILIDEYAIDTIAKWGICMVIAVLILCLVGIGAGVVWKEVKPSVSGKDQPIDMYP